MLVEVGDVPSDSGVCEVLARWSLEQWASDFPDDTLEWYLDLYRQSAVSGGLPVCLAAWADGALAGTASLVADDELPDASEPGPWVAAVYVTPEHRGHGVGAELVREALRRARMLGYDEVYLYTEAGVDWYATMGWESVRVSRLAGHPVTVMVHRSGLTTT